MSRHRSVAFVTVTDLIRDKSLGCDEAGVWAGPGDPHQHPFVISTSFMTADTSEDVKDAPDLDTIDDCVYGLDPNEPPHSSRSPAPGVATSQIQQFPENSSLVRPRLLACQPTPPAKRSLPRSKIVTKGAVAECDLSQVLVKKDDSGYGGDDLSLIDDLDSLDDPLPASNIQSNMGQPRYSGPVTSWLLQLRGAEEAEAGEEEAAARPDTSVRARLRQVQARSGAAVSLCDRLGGLEVRDTAAVLLFSSLVRSLKQRTRSLVHFYCGITEARGLPGYVYTNKTYKTELLQHLDCVTAHCDKLLRAPDSWAVRGLVASVKQLLLNCLNLIIGVQLAACLQSPQCGPATLEQALHVCISSLHVSGHVARHGGLAGVLRLLDTWQSRDQDSGQVLRLLGCLCCNNEAAVAELVTRHPASVARVAATLCDKARSEAERREAVGVLAQVSQHSAASSVMARHADTVMAAITDLVLTSSSPETLLLCAATAANLTAGRSSAHCSALLAALLGHPAATSSVHIQEQLVTVVNNVSRTSPAPAPAPAPAVDYLLDLLSLAKVPPTEEEELYQAAQRTATKAVIGLARLCLSPVTSSLLVRAGGLDRLTGVLAEPMFAEDETVKLAVVAAVRSLCSDYTESFV